MYSLAVVALLAVAQAQPADNALQLRRRIATTSQNATRARSNASSKAMCAAFARQDFRIGRMGIAANGDLLKYDRPSLECK